MRPDESPSIDFAQAYVQSTVNSHFNRRGSNIWNTKTHFPESIILNGNALEIARCFYYPSGTHAAITSPGQILDLVKGWGQIDFVSDRVNSWFGSTKGLSHKTGVGLLDLFYWRPYEQLGGPKFRGQRHSS